MKKLTAISVVIGEMVLMSGAQSIQVSEDVRVTVLSPTLIRFEERGEKGFEDRPSFLVVDRDWQGAEATAVEKDSGVGIELPLCTITGDSTGNVNSVWDSIRIVSGGTEIWSGEDREDHNPRFFAPSEKTDIWVLKDSERMIPPPWTALPPPEDKLTPSDDNYETSGWDLSFKGRDVYVFLLTEGSDHSRQEFLKLTGKIPLPPLYAFGFWTSLYFPFTEEEALRDIDTFREKDYPLDVFVLDTDWRVGGSGGYEVDQKYFPDMKRFIDRAHNKDVRLMFNDHPQPNGMEPLEPAMLKFRYEGLTSLLDMGLDSWWYDLNWPDIIREPVESIDHAFWGQYLYYHMTLAAKPDKRPLIMSMRSRCYGSQRFPIWWTGDIHATYEELETGVRDSVDDGLRLLPYVNQDLGGHFGQPDDELYVRFLQYGCLGPITRIHGTLGEGIFRYPWLFSTEAADIVREYSKLRYRLLPVIYTAARRAYDDGTPILRKLAIEWPEHGEAYSSDAYLLGDLLVAPVKEASGEDSDITTSSVWLPPGAWEDMWTGEVLKGPKTIEVESSLRHMPLYVRRGGLLITAPEMDYIGQKPWDVITAEVFPGETGSCSRDLYEDAGEGFGYQSGECSRTTVEVTASEEGIDIAVHAAEGSYPGQIEDRTWRIRVHLASDQTFSAVESDGQDVRVLKPADADDQSMVLAGWGTQPRSHAGEIVEIEFSLPRSESRGIRVKTASSGHAR